MAPLPGWPALPAHRHPPGGQGHPVRGRRALHLRLAHPGDLHPHLFRHRRRAPVGRRHGHPGQDQHRRVCHGLLHRKLRLWPHRQPLGHRPRPGWLQRRQRRRRGRPPGPARPGHRHRRQRAPAGLPVRRHRPQAQLRARLTLRPGRLWLLPGRDRRDGRQRGRHRPRLCRHGRPRPARRHLPRPARPRPALEQRQRKRR